MNIRVHQVPDGLVDEPVALQRAQPRETRRDDANLKMPTPVTGAGVPDVLMTFVDDLEFGRVQGGFDASANLFDARFVQGSTCLNGLTMTFS